jgi:hypothetical protein
MSTMNKDHLPLVETRAIVARHEKRERELRAVKVILTVLVILVVLM